MQPLETLIRSRQTRNTSPPRAAQSLKCDDQADTVILQLGKGGQGRVLTVSHSVSVKRYMTKQQREICIVDQNAVQDQAP